MSSKLALILLISAAGIINASGPVLASLSAPTSSSSSPAQPEYIVVMGREDKHSIVRYDINSPIFKQPYTHIKNPAPTSGTWSMNFRDFLREDELPEICKTQHAKKKFFSNIATDIGGDC